VRELHVVHFLRTGGHGWVGLGEEAHGCVVEHAGDDGGTFDQPGVVSLNSEGRRVYLTRLPERLISTWSGRNKDTR